MSEVEVSTDLRVPVKVTLKPFRKNSHLDEGHDGEYRFSRTFESLTVQIDRGTNILNTGLTPEEEASLETQMNLPKGSLSKYNRAWWANFKINIPANGVELRPKTVPMDYLKWKVCLVHQEVAKSEAEKAFTPFANYVLSSVEDENRETLKVVEKKSQAFAKFNNMSVKEMKDFLLVYGKLGKIDASAPEEFIKAQTGKVVEENPEVFMNILEDKTFKMKAFIKECIDANLITQDRTKYSLQGGDILGLSLEQAVDYLFDKTNQEIYMALKSQLKASK